MELLYSGQRLHAIIHYMLYSVNSLKKICNSYSALSVRYGSNNAIGVFTLENLANESSVANDGSWNVT